MRVCSAALIIDFTTDTINNPLPALYMKNYRNQQHLNINADNFIDNPSMYHAYILGLLWADGYIISKYKKKEIRLEMKADDMNTILEIFSYSGDWTISTRTRIGRTPQMTLVCNNAKLVDYLVNVCDYNNKSISTPDVILDMLSIENKKYFLRGWIDGDGCFYHNKLRGLNQFYVSGAYEQDWGALEKILNENLINYKIQRIVTNKNHRYSCIRVINITNIKKIYSILYSGSIFGIPRKLNKCLSIINQ